MKYSVCTVVFLLFITRFSWILFIIYAQVHCNLITLKCWMQLKYWLISCSFVVQGTHIQQTEGLRLRHFSPLFVCFVDISAAGLYFFLCSVCCLWILFQKWPVNFSSAEHTTNCKWRHQQNVLRINSHPPRSKEVKKKKSVR